MLKQKTKILILCASIIVCAVISLCLIFALNSRQKLTISFIDQDRVLSQQTIKVGQTVDEPINPEKSGFIFLGWYYDAEFNTPFNFSKKVDTDKDFNLYARFEVDNGLNGVEIFIQDLEFDGQKFLGQTASQVNSVSFLQKVTVAFGAEYQVYDSIDCVHAIDKNANLEFGNNTFFIKVINGRLSAVYQVEIYRKSAFIVSFNTDGGENISPITLEEGEYLIEPTVSPNKQGYIFIGWDYDFNVAVTSSFTINAVWQQIEAVPYKVEYYFEDAFGQYQLNQTIELSAFPSETVSAQINDYEHYTPTQSQVSGVVLPDGSLTLKVYYDRQFYRVRFFSSQGELVTGEEVQQIKYGDGALAPVYAKRGYVYEFNKDYEWIESDTDVWVVWSIEKFSITYNLNYGHMPTQYLTEYTVESSDVVLANAVKENARFVGWYLNGQKIDKIVSGTVGDLVLDAVWEDYFIIENGQLKGFTDYGKSLNLTSLTIPETFDEVDIISVGDNAFSNCDNIVSVELSKNIVSVYVCHLKNQKFCGIM